MPLVYTAEDLIESVRNRAAVADVASEGSSDADILRYATEFMYTTLVPELRKFQEEYFVKNYQVSTSSGQSRYRIPTRAIANTLRDVNFISNGARTTIAQIAREQLFRYGTTSAEIPTGFYIEGNHLVLINPPTNAGTLEMSYFFRPGQLTTDYRIVDSVDTGTKTITTTESLPADWSTSDLFDVHSPYSGAENKAFDLVATTAGAMTLTVTSEIDGSEVGTDAIAAGDYVTLANNAAVPGVPIEAQPIVVEGAALRLVQATGDIEGVQVHERALIQQVQDLRHTFENRVKGKPKKLVNHGAVIWRQGGYSGSRY